MSGAGVTITYVTPAAYLTAVLMRATAGIATIKPAAPVSDDTDGET